MRAGRPIVGISCDRRLIDGQAVHGVAEEYIAAVTEGAGALPLLVPVPEPPLDAGAVLGAVDGLLLTGAASNVSPSLYGGAPPRPDTPGDGHRDAAALALVRAAVTQGVPVFGICRGLQEINVAFGGTLHQHVHEIAGRLDHREDERAPLAVQYGPAHPVRVAGDGLLARIVAARDFPVNSLHGQGIDRLAPPLHADAHAPDGQIEAVSMPGAKAFLLAVQWHPEWNWDGDAVSRCLFAAFGAALRG